jgi:hypothetical protein
MPAVNCGRTEIPRHSGVQATPARDEKQIARNLARQLTVYATGASVRFGDREPIEQILERAASSHYGVRSLIHELVQSELFRRK